MKPYLLAIMPLRDPGIQRLSRKFEKRRDYSGGEHIRSMLEGLRGETGTADLCRKESLNSNGYYKRHKKFLEMGKKCLRGDTVV